MSTSQLATHKPMTAKQVLCIVEHHIGHTGNETVMEMTAQALDGKCVPFQMFMHHIVTEEYERQMEIWTRMQLGSN